MNIDDFSPDIQRQIRRKLGIQDRAAVSARNLEPGLADGSEGTVSVKAAHTGRRVRVVITGRRHRLVDADGQNGKAVIDSLVAGGILGDDSPEYVSGVEMRQEKIPMKDAEETVVEIYEDAG